MLLKYVDVQVTFSEIPEEITLCINISNCHNHCEGCHSPHLWEDIGNPLTFEVLDNLISKNKGISCVCFMGGDSNHSYIRKLVRHIKANYNLKVGWYSGVELHQIDIPYDDFDYIKTGPYIKELGGLDSPNTNQRLYKLTKPTDRFGFIIWKDITKKLQTKIKKNEINN